MMKKKTIDTINIKSKRVLMRVDFNGPLNEKKEITDAKRIIESLPTINKIIQNGGRLVLISHLGRPKGKPDANSLKPIADFLSVKLGKHVHFATDCVGEQASSVVNKLEDGDVALLENLRFHSEEEKNDSDFSKKLASLADIYVNDAFGTAHRAHASTQGVTKFIPIAVAGYLMEKELNYLGLATSNPKRPFVAILGGSKISGKIDVIEHLMDKVETILIGGAMIFTFFKAKGLNVGASLVENDKLNLALSILEKASKKNVNLLLPTDVVIGDKFAENAHAKVVSISEIPDTWIGLDIGTETAKKYADVILQAKTVLWNGPMGVFEMKKFANGTLAMIQALVTATKSGATTIVGGGDSAAAISIFGFAENVSHVSTGGGASLEFLEGKLLPGVEALNNA
ncbi:hypothetical protein CHS0354_023928 [Potamilus streckersoni]|uniref:Phosphoglycerate kinase n=1 Tax=Potamilus streckersoni TaxID=2493646 RepID=A0AAE0RZC9_9BIVA|nr:hypothetical protein CHS0354_023928 [Potamilus streckersoni]